MTSLGYPVVGAEIQGAGLRTDALSGDWYSWSGEPSKATTGPDGRARLRHPLWFQTTAAWSPVNRVAFDVEHPDYVPYREGGFPAGEGECRVVLKRGSFLIVSGWIDSPERVIAEVVPHLSDRGEIGFEEWMPIADGRLSCDKIRPGVHAICLSFEGRPGDPWCSEIVQFTLAEEELKELHLELLPPRRLRGALDPSVPRPVEEGQVELCIYTGVDGEGPILARCFEADVAADGTFELGGLPPGQGEIIGLCRGWASSGPAPPAEGQVVDRWIQQVDPGALEEPFVLRMEPTASLEVTVLDPGGEPLPGARLILSPNVYWTCGDSDFFLNREFKATSDARGIASLDDLPSEEDEFVYVHHPDYRMPLNEAPWGGERRYAWADLVSGETTRVTVQLEEPGED